MITYTYNALITNVVDGDTIDATLDLGFNVNVNMRFRLNGIDTPELHSKDIKLREKAQAAKKFLVDQILNKNVTIKSTKADKYGRWLADIQLDIDAASINEQLITLGLAKKYMGEQKSGLWE